MEGRSEQRLVVEGWGCKTSWESRERPGRQCGLIVKLSVGRMVRCLLAALRSHG